MEDKRETAQEVPVQEQLRKFKNIICILAIMWLLTSIISFSTSYHINKFLEYQEKYQKDFLNKTNSLINKIDN